MIILRETQETARSINNILDFISQAFLLSDKQTEDFINTLNHFIESETNMEEYEKDFIKSAITFIEKDREFFKE